MDFPNSVTKDKGYGENFMTYKKPKKKKYIVIVNNINTKFEVNYLIKLRLSNVVMEASQLPFF